MERTVSAAKGVRKLSLGWRVICTWTWSRAVTSLYIRESSNGVECQPLWLFCRRGATRLVPQRAHFHGSQINHATCWTTMTPWLTLTNETKPAASVRKTTRAQSGNMLLSHLEEHNPDLSSLYHNQNTKKMKAGGGKKALETLGGSSLQELYLHCVQHSGSSVDKYSHILIFQLAWLLFSKHMQTQRGVH